MNNFEALNNEDEQITDGGLGILFKKKLLYHGSGVSGISEFTKAENDTVGSGVYFTSDLNRATEYARRRSGHNGEQIPVLYEVTIEDMKLLDLRKDENVRIILAGFRNVLKEKLKTPNLKYYAENTLIEAIENIDLGKATSGRLREVTFHWTEAFSDYVESLGYDGLVTFEGGEGNGQVGSHDTFLIFSPKKITINKEEKIQL